MNNASGAKKARAAAKRQAQGLARRFIFSLGGCQRRNQSQRPPKATKNTLSKRARIASVPRKPKPASLRKIICRSAEGEKATSAYQKSKRQKAFSPASTQ